jgi:hypothetical protein
VKAYDHDATVSEIVAQIARHSSHKLYGLRLTDERLDLGQVLGPSRRWFEWVPTNECLSGTSAVACQYLRVDRRKAVEWALFTVQGYAGHFVALLGANACEKGEDQNEIVMEKPTVLATWPCCGWFLKEWLKG